MICNCSKCDKKLRIPESMAGRMVMCPNCKNKFRVVLRETTKIDGVADERVAKEPRPNRSPSAPSKKVHRSSLDDDGPPPKRSRLPVDEELDELEEVGRADRRIDEEEPRRRSGAKRKKKKRAKLPYWLTNPSPLTIVLSGILALGFFIALVGLFIPVFFSLILLAAMVGYVVGHFMVVIAAFQEGGAHGLLCLLFGPYTLIFAIMHFDQVRAAWLVWGASFILFIFLLCGGVLHGLLFGTSDPSFSPEQEQKTQPAVQWVGAF